MSYIVVLSEIYLILCFFVCVVFRGVYFHLSYWLVREKKQGCIKFLIPDNWGEEFIKSFGLGEEFQVVKRGRENKGFWEEYHAEKRVRGSNIICSIIIL